MTKYQQEVKRAKHYNQVAASARRIYKNIDKDTATVFICQSFKCSLINAQYMVEHICEGMPQRLSF